MNPLLALTLDIKLPPSLESWLTGTNTEMLQIKLVALVCFVLVACYLLFHKEIAMRATGLAVVVGLLIWLLTQAQTKAQPVSPVPVPVPMPTPTPAKPKPWRPFSEPIEQLPIGKVSLGGNVGPDGKTEVQVDLPVEQRFRNIGSKVDGAGMCVMSSIEMSARWAGLEQMRGLRDWCAKQRGGGYPSKVDRQLKEYCDSKGIPVPDYIQYEGPDSAILETALKSGRMPAATYSGQDGVRYRGPIAHMIDVVCFIPGKLACVLDNNGIGENELLWMTPEDYVQRWKGHGGGWCFVWLEKSPPPVPRNLKQP